MARFPHFGNDDGACDDQLGQTVPTTVHGASAPVDRRREDQRIAIGAAGRGPRSFQDRVRGLALGGSPPHHPGGATRPRASSDLHKHP